MNPDNSEETRWFLETVHPHERSLRSYLRGSFPAVRDVDDVVQESYLRVLRSRLSQPVSHAKAFLFTVARHLAIDQARRDRASPVDVRQDLAEMAVIDERPGVAEVLSVQEKIQLLGEAIAALPTRCRTIVILRKLREMPQREVAAQLGISEKAVEAQVSRGIERCARYFQRRSVFSYYDEKA